MKRFIILCGVLIIAITQNAFNVLHTNGIAGYNNSPGEVTCTSCHATYSLNSAGGNVSINIPSCANNNYVAGQTYIVNVKIVRAGLYLFGFSIESLDSTGANAGTLAIINPNTTILINALVNGNNRANITHYGGVLSQDSCVFSFSWIAPNLNVGKIFFYAAANASNNDGYLYGDYVYTASQELNPVLSTYVPNDTAFENRINIYPNPTSNLFYIEANTTDKIIVDLYNENGKHVFNKSIRNKSFIDVTTFCEGVYTVSIKTGDRLICKKLMVLH